MPARPPLQEIDEVEEYLFRVKEMCGELCDYTKEVVPGKLLGTVSSKVFFDSLGSFQEIYQRISKNFEAPSPFELHEFA